MPRSHDALQAQHVLLGGSIEEAAQLFFEACSASMDPSTRDEGRGLLQHLVQPLNSASNWARLPGNRMFSSRSSDERQQHVWRSYLVGATPEHGYRVDVGAWELRFEWGYLREADERGTSVFLLSSGADVPWALCLLQDEDSGLWFVNVWDELLAEVRPPLTDR